MLTVADHRIDQLPDGDVRVTLTVRQTGPPAPLAGALFGPLTRRYPALEAAGLQRFCLE